jgi:lysophospholipase L1-like esterase
MSAAVAAFLRVFAWTLALLLALGIVLEVALRAFGVQPQNLYKAGYDITVIDPWTAWAMRPSVHVGDYAVTNYYGLHDDREVTLAKPPDVKRIAVVGSSVAFGHNEALDNTLSRVAERTLRARGCRAEVLNFGVLGYNILNASALVQAKVHQFDPDAIVVMMDMQMVFPAYPRPAPATDERLLIHHRGLLEAGFERLTEYSALLTMEDDTVLTRRTLATYLPFPVQPKAEAAVEPKPAAAGLGPLQRLADRLEDWAVAATDRLKSPDQQHAIIMKPAPDVPPAAHDESVKTHEARRKRELGAPVAGVSAHAREMGIPLYFVTPYGPYFSVTSRQIAGFSLGMLADSIPVYGTVQAALAREAQLSHDIIVDAARAENARVIDMEPLTRGATMASGEFKNDGIHFTPRGYRHVGELIAERMLADGICPPR